MARGDLPPPGDASRLGAYLQAPVNIDKVMAVMRAADRPLRLCEIAERAGIPNTSASTALARLHSRGELQRWKLPVTIPGGVPNGPRKGELVPVRRMVNVYVVPEPEGE